ARHDGDLLLLPSLQEAVVHGRDYRIPSNRGERRHVENGSHRGAATPDGSGALEGPAVAIERSYPDELGGLLAVHLSELGQLRQDRPGGDRPDTRDRPQQLLLLAPQRALADGLVDVVVGSTEGFFEPGDVFVDALAQ